MAYDFQRDFSSGQHNGLTPALSNSSYYQGVNVHARNGYAAVRNPDVQIRLSEHLTGRYQGSTVYNPGTGERVVLVIDGNLYEIWSNGTVNAISTDTPLSTEVSRCQFVQANRYLVVQDGVNTPVVVEDATYTVRDTIPIGRYMASGNGYLAVVSANSQSIHISNISTFLEDEDEILKFTAQPATLTPFGIGSIKGLTIAPVLDSGTGMGALLAFGDTGRVFGYDLTIPRDDWGSTTGFGRVVAEGLFLASHNSIQSVGGDLYMRTVTGLDTLNLARADFQASRNRNISRPVEGWLRNDAPGLLHAVDAVFWDDRLYVTSSPLMQPDGQIAFQDVVVYDAAHGLRAEPAYPGIERGTTPVALHVVDGRLVTVAQVGEGGVLVYQRPPAGGARVSLPWWLETRTYDWGAPQETKGLDASSSYVHVDFLRPGSVDLLVKFDDKPGWTKWTTIEADLPEDAQGFIYQHSEKFKLPALPEVRKGGRLYGRSFHTLQIRFQGTVPVRIREIALDSSPQVGGSRSPNSLDPGRVSHYNTQ